jgi:hypothetical protein
MRRRPCLVRTARNRRTQTEPDGADDRGGGQAVELCRQAYPTATHRITASPDRPRPPAGSHLPLKPQYVT